MKRKGALLAAIVMSVSATGVSAEKSFTVKSIKKGGYAFSFEGEIIGVGPVVAAGVMESDGNGNITEAVRTISINGVPTTQTFTCSYSINPDGSGSATCPLDNPGPGFPSVETFDLALEDKAHSFRFVGTTPGVAVLGSGTRQ